MARAVGENVKGKDLSHLISHISTLEMPVLSRSCKTLHSLVPTFSASFFLNHFLQIQACPKNLPNPGRRCQWRLTHYVFRYLKAMKPGNEVLNNACHTTLC